MNINVNALTAVTLEVITVGVKYLPCSVFPRGEHMYFTYFTCICACKIWCDHVKGFMCMNSQNPAVLKLDKVKQVFVITVDA